MLVLVLVFPIYSNISFSDASRTRHLLENGFLYLKTCLSIMISQGLSFYLREVLNKESFPGFEPNKYSFFFSIGLTFFFTFAHSQLRTEIILAKETNRR